MLSDANAGRRAWTAGLGSAGEAALVVFVALVPIIRPDVLPKPQALLMLLTPPAPVPPPTDVIVKPCATHAPVERALISVPTRIPTSPASLNVPRSVRRPGP
jgi:hypothetical protein